MSYQDGLKQASVNLDPLAALRAPVTILLGVSTPAADLLRPLGVTTVFDLATLPLFGLAREIVEAANERGAGAVARLDTVPGGYVSAEEPPSLDALAGAEPTALRGVNAALAQQLKNVLQIETVGDLGRWLPFKFARQILEAATRESNGYADPAAELVPRMGEYPTERCFYTTMLIDHVEAAATRDLKTAGAIDIAPSVNAEFGFSAPAVGARLTFAQSWFAHGVTLGNLLHSVALAPGESTRIAVVDWTRRTVSSATESITEAEQLAASTSHNRAVSEVQDAVATEAQSGFSHTESKSTTKQGGVGIGVSVGPVSLGGSASAGKTTTSADSFSSSVGSRELAASMSQKVMDSTQQAASSVRDRRASLVMEVSETEHESVSTRILANYNHMHALTVQYYEVIEIYRVTVELTQVERALFVPMKLVEFNEAAIRRYQAVLAAAALNRRARELLSTEFGTVRVSPVARRRPWPGPLDIIATTGTLTMARRATDGGTEPAEPPAPAEPPPPVPPPQPPVRPPVTALPAFDMVEIARASRIAALDVVRPGSADVYLPRDAALSGVALQLNEALVPASAVTLKLASGEPPVQLASNGVEWRAPQPVLLQEISEIVLTTTGASGSGTGRMTLQLSYHGALFPVTIPIPIAPSTTATVARMGDLDVGPELLEQLRGNRLHYSQAIWRSLDASTIALLLSRFTFEGQPVADLVDPQPLMIAGNYVVLRMPAFTERKDAPPDRQPGAGPLGAARAAWRKWLEERGLVFGRVSTSEQLVPIPTGGVFAEAVLGRSNSAEKLDATRFWNWQDSPIPLAPPEIAAINLGSRAQPVDARPGQLGQPVLNIVNPTALPDPTGLGPMLGALQNGNMFRDMSGLAATIGLAQAVAGTSGSAAASAGQLANANLAVAAQKDIEQQRIAAQLAMAAMGNPAALGGSPKSSSEMGALINSADQRDRSRASSPAAGSSSTGSVSTDDALGGDSSGALDGEVDGGGSAGDFMPGVAGSLGGGDDSLGDSAFRRALFGQLGVPAGELLLADTRGRRPTKKPAPPKLPTLKTDEHYHLASFLPPPEWADVALEVAALKDFSWKPSIGDFQALAKSISVAGNIKVTDTLRRFMNFLAFPNIKRFNFYGYGLNPHPYTIGLAGQVETSGLSGSHDNSLDSKGFNVDVLSAMINEANAHPNGAVSLLLKEARESHHPDAELWLYLCNFAPTTDDLPKLIAQTFKIKTVVFTEPIWFLPDFVESPPSIKDRARIGIGPGPQRDSALATMTPDPYKLDGDSRVKRFNP